MKTDKTLTMRQIIIRSCMLLFVVPLMVFCWILFYYSAKTIHGSVIAEQQSVVGLMNLVLEKQLKQMDQNLNRIYLDREIQRILAETDFNKFNSKLAMDFRYLDRFMDSMNADNDLKMESAILVTKEEDFYTNTFVSKQFFNDVVLKEWCPAVRKENGKSVILGVVKDERNQDVLVLGKMMRHPQTLQLLGILFTTYSVEDLFQPLQSRLSNTTDIYVVKNDNTVLYSDAPNKDEFADFLNDNRAALEQEGYLNAEKSNERIVYIASSKENMKLCVFSCISFSTVRSQLLKQQITVIFLGIICIVLFAVFLRYMNRKLYKPIEAITKGGEKGEIINGTDSDCYELKQISDTIMSLSKKSADGEAEIVKLVEKCESVTLEKLQAQINPHFLYNTLTNIKYISILNHQEQISQLISALVKLLRSTVGRDGDMIPLSEEIENVEYYMLIQNVVYNGNICFTIDVDPDIKDLQVPNFILQPLVENCIFHGIYPSEKGGEITITGSRKGEEILLQIKDNGVGFCEDSLMNFMQAGDPKKGGQMTNLGIKAVHKKIQLLCGEDYGIKIFSKKNEGSMVNINLPCRVKQEADQ